MDTAKTPRIKRIQARSVVAAFKKTNTFPFRGGWHNRAQDQDGPLGCCGLGVMFLKTSGKDRLLGLVPSQFAYAVKDTLGLDTDYMWGFVAGFDGRQSNPEKVGSAVYQRGYQDGSDAWDATEPLREPQTGG